MYDELLLDTPEQREAAARAARASSESLAVLEELQARSSRS